MIGPSGFMKAPNTGESRPTENRLYAELDRLKAHAEAMAKALDAITNRYCVVANNSTVAYPENTDIVARARNSVAAYRKDYP